MSFPSFSKYLSHCVRLEKKALRILLRRNKNRKGSAYFDV